MEIPTDYYFGPDIMSSIKWPTATTDPIVMSCHGLSSLWWTTVLTRYESSTCHHDDVIKWKYFSRYWPFVRGIHRSPVNSPHKGQWREALMFPLICVWISGWVNNGEAGDLMRHRAHYDVTVMTLRNICCRQEGIIGRLLFWRCGIVFWFGTINTSNNRAQIFDFFLRSDSS